MSEAQCSQGATDPTWSWVCGHIRLWTIAKLTLSTAQTWNRLGQDPCTIYRVLSGEGLGSIATGGYYSLQAALNDTYIDCSTVGYSLISACAGCQGGTWLS